MLMAKIFKYTTSVIIYEDEVWAYLENIAQADVTKLKEKGYVPTDSDWYKTAEYALETGDFISCDLSDVQEII